MLLSSRAFIHASCPYTWFYCLYVRDGVFINEWMNERFAAVFCFIRTKVNKTSSSTSCWSMLCSAIRKKNAALNLFMVQFNFTPAYHLLSILLVLIYIIHKTRVDKRPMHRPELLNRASSLCGSAHLPVKIVGHVRLPDVHTQLDFH